MKTFKDVVFTVLVVLLAILFLTDIFAVVHTVYFTFTHIHLTRMEALVDSNNFMFPKIILVATTYVIFTILSRWS